MSSYRPRPHRRIADQPGRISNASAAQRMASEAKALQPAHARGIAVFSEEWYLAQQEAFSRHMAALGIPPATKNATEPQDALVMVSPNGPGRGF
jgi:hypothetical protein